MTDMKVNDDGTMESAEDEGKTEKVEDIDKIGPRDHGKMFSVAQFKTWRRNLMGNLNGVLQAFQKDIITGQVRLNLAWNTMNAVVRAMVNKGIITENDLRDAGVELMKEARANVDKARAAQEAGTTPGLVGSALAPTPIEKFRDDVNKKMAAEKKE